MAKVGFHILRPWVAFLSIHPYWLLYLKSDGYFFLVYHLLRYRRKVVRQNLLNSFPDKDVKEIKRIEKRFYQNLCDLFVEAPKMLRIKSNGYQSRITYANTELLTHLFEQGKNVFYAIPHSGNWEWFGKMTCELTQHKCLAIYKKVKSPVFERLMHYIRTCHSELEMVESNSALRRLAQLRNCPNAVLMMADQTSYGLESDYWTEFLHQDTCWFTGIARISQKLDYAIVFVDMKRKDRGHYEVSFELLTDNPKTLAADEIMERYVRCVERFIEANPDNWLWSHRRWKHKRPQIVEA